MAFFNLAFPYTLAHEGGWSNDPDDPGGATNYGITLAVAQRHGVADEAALREIPRHKVEEIYRADYWRFDGFKDQRVAGKVFDMAVNFGLAAAVTMLQQILNRWGSALAVDGICGPKTTAAVNLQDAGVLLGFLCAAAADRYRLIVARRPETAKFLKGWLRRAGEVPA